MKRKIIITDQKKFTIDGNYLGHLPRIGDAYHYNNLNFKIIDIISEANNKEFITFVYVKMV
jgi:hypothetical protein